MIVDLMRNDLGRIADLGSVSVTDLFTVETFKTLHQMTSGVRAVLKGGRRHRRFVAGYFPAGIDHGRAENPGDGIDPRVGNRARGVYCGAIGYFAPDGRRCSTSQSGPP